MPAPFKPVTEYDLPGLPQAGKRVEQTLLHIQMRLRRRDLQRDELLKLEAKVEVIRLLLTSTAQEERCDTLLSRIQSRLQ